MAGVLFAFDGPNYSRYLLRLDIFLTKIDEIHPGAKELPQEGGISAACSLLLGALGAVNKMMEQTFIKFAMSAGAFSGIFHKFGAYERWCRATSPRAQYHKKLLVMCDDPDYRKKGSTESWRKLKMSRVRKQR